MKRLRNILIPCLLAILCTPSAALAQQNREQMAAYYFDHGDFAQAAQLYESLYQRGNNKFYYQRLLATYLEMEQYKEALKLVQQRQKTAPKDLYLFVDEGNIHIRQGQEKKAMKCYDKAIAQIGNNLQPIPDLAMAFLTAGRPSYAAQTYLTARSKTRNNTLYFNELIGVYQQMGDYEAMTGEYFDLLDHQPGMMQSIQISMQRTLKEAPDERLADGVRRALVSRVQEHPENRNYQEMMIWFSIQQNDYRFALEQAQAIDARFPESGDDQVMRVAQIAQNNGAFDVAIDGYQHLQQKGPDNAYYFDSRVGELEVEFARINHNYSIDSKSFAQLREKYLAAFAELGKNERTLPLMRHYATLIAYHGGDVQEAVSMLDDALELPRLKAKTRDEVKLELGDLLLFAGETWDASLLYIFQRIIEPYKGNVLYVDFWEMSCGPCRNLMLNMRDEVEANKEKPVKYLYITDDSEEKCRPFLEPNNIKGEHIHITPAEWGYLREKFQFTGIPFTVLFDKDGKQRDNVTVDEVLKEISEE